MAVSNCLEMKTLPVDSIRKAGFTAWFLPYLIAGYWIVLLSATSLLDCYANMRTRTVFDVLSEAQATTGVLL